MLLHPNSIAFTRAQLQTNKNPLPLLGEVETYGVRLVRA